MAQEERSRPCHPHLRPGATNCDAKWLYWRRRRSRTYSAAAFVGKASAEHRGSSTCKSIEKPVQQQQEAESFRRSSGSNFAPPSLLFVPAPAEKTGVEEEHHHYFLVHFMMGGVAASVSKTAAAPIERVKMLLQLQGEQLKSGRLSEPYKGIADCFLRILREEGVLALWRGNFTNVIRYFPTQAFNFAFKDYFRDLLAFRREKDGYSKWFLGNVLSGGAAGAASSVFVYSLDYARTRLTSDSGNHLQKRQFNGLSDVYRKTIHSDGILGLYRGFRASVLGIIFYRGLYFGIYDSVKPVVLVGALQDSFAASFGLAFVVTTIAGSITYPLDTIRRRMMLTSGEAVKYMDTTDAFQQIIAKEGVKALFKGGLANILLGLAGAGVLAGYDKLQLIVFGRAFRPPSTEAY
ncbi:hypothetical protein CY35_01G051600 [Sphagnum magellanicum]|nr:hypothetical protein CY35_01G051600 [Sphagnum magellanicum]